MKNNSKFNRGFIVPLIITIVGILVIGGIVYFSYEKGKSAQVVQVSQENAQSIVPTAPIVSTSSSQTYTNSQYNYTFQYPSDFALAANLTPAQQSMNSSYMESCATRGEGERQVLDGSYDEINSLCYVGNETTDGFDASAFNVFVSTSTSVSDCQKIEQKGDEGSAYQQQTQQTTIGGITFYEDTLNDAGLSHYVDTNSFRTYHEGVCYDIQLDIESHAGDSSTWKLDPQFVAMMNSKLESILSTFKFTN